MSRIPQSFIDDLLSRLDIVDVVDRRVKLKRTGKNYAACCPFHDEKTPSFSVSPDKQFYYCFGCGASGNAIGFLMEYERQGFVDAVESLAHTAGMEVPKEESPQRDKQDSRRKALFDKLEKAASYYQQQLKNHPDRTLAVDYLKNRGLTGQIAKDFGLGLAPTGWDNLIKEIGHSQADLSLLTDAGLVIHNTEQDRYYDRFRNRIIFPIRDIRGRIIGFGGRVLGDDKPKYLNSPETDVFHKGKELYGFYEAKQANRNLDAIVVVEGYMDVIALAQYGISNAVATLGTACGEDHLNLAFRHVHQVIFCFDGDQAGIKAAKRALTNSLPAMEDGRQIKFLFLAEGHDPDSLVRQIGADRFNAQLEDAIPLEDFLFDVAAEGININTMDGRARFSKIAAPMIGQLPEGVYRQLMFDNLAKRTGLSAEVLRELQADTTATETAINQEAEHPSSASKSSQPAVQTPVTPAYQPTNDGYDDIAPADIEHHPIPDEYHHDTPPENQAPVNRAKPAQPSSNVSLTPPRIATILLLENPSLLAQVTENIDITQSDDIDTQRLIDIITYLKKRPNSNYNNIMGFWAGAYGLDSQQALIDLINNPGYSSVKNMAGYCALQELTASLKMIMRKQVVIQYKKELDELKNKPASQLSADERKRYIELISAVAK